ncbi:T9SS type A sorting domain-containing protein [Flavobacterium supellecticarium]|uniref:T9SS type A sorting domain-containing protein n=1 Tax=Flavobacterium supellecticarium TaxID=2565924 RepID=A0A4S3ZTY6_9FLAO|nr:choice-of-anchor J domain-containing protein [Flavobacterium supellecticarium]THF49125.1 T9SS type A sorting domain-containing protein [Flavobacterium supellecticarium]
MKKKLLSLLFCLPLFGQAQNLYNYGFNGTTADLTTAGWVRTNQSTTASTTLWTVASYTPVVVSATVNPTPFQTQAYTTGQTCPIPNGQDGTPNTFALVNFTSTSSTLTSGATISNWLISPVVTVQNGDVISFYTRLGKYSATNTASYADNLQVRMSTNGAATVNPSTGPTAVGDFTNLLVEINPTQNLTSYPTNWTQYSYTVTGLTGPTAVKIGFRYFVTNGGPNGSNSDIIGIDTFSVDRPLGTQDFFAKNFSVFPNPANDVLNIAAKNGMEIKGIQVTDLNGRIVKSVAVQGQAEAQINVSDLTAGAYFVSVQSNEGTATSKFLKN